MAKPSVIEARKARALEAMQAQLDRIEAKLDAVLSGAIPADALDPVVELEPVGEQASEPQPEPAPEKAKGNKK